MSINFKKILLISILLVTPIAIGYWKILTGFFQQDEFLVFARLITEGANGFQGALSYAFIPDGPHYTPLTRLVTFTMFQFFQIQYVPFAVFSLMLNSLAILLVFVLASHFLKKRTLSFLTALIFAILAGHNQATSWVLVNISTQGATIFALLSLILFTVFLRKEKIYLFVLSLLSLVFSLLFKETTTGVFLLLLSLPFLLGIHKKRFNKYLIVIAVTASLYIGFRGVSLLTLKTGNTDSLTGVNQTTSGLVKNFSLLPIYASTQTLIPSGQIVEVSKFIGARVPSQKGLIGDPIHDVFIVTKVLPLVSIFVFTMVAILIYSLLRKNRQKNDNRGALLGIVWMIASVPILIFSPEGSYQISIIDSRNLYLVSIGTAFLVSFLYEGISQKYIKYSLLALLILLNIVWLNKDLNIFVERSQERKGILEAITNSYPNFSKQTIVYTESDQSYYGLPDSERIFPFQSGFGQTLLIWYYPSVRYPTSFYKNKLLWEITDQSYFSDHDYSFGYFRSFPLLVKTLTEEDLETETVIAFEYDSMSKNITNKTIEVQGRIDGYFSKKRKLNPSFTLESSRNASDLPKITDSKRDTFWSSKIPYSIPLSIDIDLRNLTKLGEIVIDSYENKDQNTVGYKISLSTDQKSWVEVFSAKRYPPDANGRVELYFKPTDARYIKIEQIGYHKFAEWVIHELEIYEVY